MKGRSFLLFLVLLVTLTIAFAADYTISKQIITMEINSDGGAQIIERFYLTFPTNESKVNFRNISKTTGSDFEKWAAVDPKFSPSIGPETISTGKIAYNEVDSYLEIRYELQEPLMAKGKETAMVAEYSIKANYFNSYYQSGIWIIPDNVKMVIQLPPGAEIKDNIEPPSEITKAGNITTITWDGYKSANRLTVNYILWKKVAPVIDISSIVTLLFKTTQGQILILITAIIIMIVIWKKKFINDTIEKFVEENSKIEEE